MALALAVCVPERGATGFGAQQLGQTVAGRLALANMQLHESLQHQMMRDAFTGVFNRRYLEQALAHELRLAARQQRPLGLMVVYHLLKYGEAYEAESNETYHRSSTIRTFCAPRAFARSASTFSRVMSCAN
jgi:hypothetical protein